MRHTASAEHGAQLPHSAAQNEQAEREREDRQGVPDRVHVVPAGIGDQPADADEGGRNK